MEQTSAGALEFSIQTENAQEQRFSVGFPSDSVVKKKKICLQRRSCRFDPWVGKIPYRRAWQPTPVFLPGESRGQRSLVAYSPQGHKDSFRDD